MNRVTKLTGSRYPIIQAPMGWIARRKLASAVCNAGGLGIIETSSGEVENCIAEIQAMPELTNQPFGVNLPLLFLADDKMVNIVNYMKIFYIIFHLFYILGQNFFISLYLHNIPLR